MTVQRRVAERTLLTLIRMSSKETVVATKILRAGVDCSI